MNDQVDLKRSRRRRGDSTSPDCSRLPPHSVECEQGIIGCQLLDPVICIPEVADRFGGSVNFHYDLRHQEIQKCLFAMWQKNIPVAMISMMQWLKEQNMLDKIGGFAYLNQLQDVPSAANLSYYLEKVAEKFLLRNLIQTCTGVVGRIYDFEGDVPQLLDEVEKDILKIAESGQQQKSHEIKSLVNGALVTIEKMFNRQGELSGIGTGFTDLDKMTDGFHGGEMIIVAARPSMGKTSLALNIAEHVALELGLPVGVFSLEMTAASLILRMLCSLARVNLRTVRDGFMSQSDFPKLMSASGRISGSKLFIDDEGGLSIMQLRARARRMHQQHGIKLFVIDYLQLLHSTGQRRDENRQQEIADISGAIKALAKELNVPVIALSQLNRELEKDKSRKPRLSDLRESGCLSKETQIYTPNHNSTIGEMTIDADNDSVYSVDMKNSTVMSSPRKVWKTGTKKVFQMTLSTGHKIKATANHKFLSCGKWLPLGMLSADDMVAIPLNAPLPNQETITLSEARLLGLFVSNGCTLARRSVQITLNSQDADLAKQAMKDAGVVFNGELRPHAKKESHKSRPGSSWVQVFFPSVRVPSKVKRSVLVEWLIKHGLYDKRAKQKKIPDVIFRQPISVVREFLSALFSGDGCCCLTTSKKNPNKHQYVVASYSSSSRELVDGVQWLLQCCGIVSGISTVSCRGFVNHTLSVYSRCSKIKFAEQIGFLSKRKDKAMSAIVKKMLAAPLGYEKYIPEGDLVYVPIKSIFPMGLEEVWDMEVPSTNNFVANGIVVHNSIEQDADLVGLLYKPDSNKDEESEEETEACAINFLIAKQRNGPTGDVHFTFLKTFTRFEQASKYADVPGDPRNPNE